MREFLCWFGFHKYGKWSEPQTFRVHPRNPYTKQPERPYTAELQERRCVSCNAKSTRYL